MTDADFENLDGDTDNSASGSGSGTPVDWEARFKGLQKRFNQQQREMQRVQEQLETKTETATNLQRQVNDLKGEKSSIAGDYDARITQLEADLQAAQSERDSFSAQAESLTSQVAQMETDADNRKFLAGDENYRDLIPFYDSGYLKLDQGDEEAKREYLEGFRQMMGNRSAGEFNKSMSGTTPRNAGSGGATNEGRWAGMSVDEMASQLTRMAPGDDRDSLEQAYFDKVAKS